MQNAYLLAEIGAGTAENERNFAKTWPKIGNTLRVPGDGGPLQEGRGRRAAG